MLDNDLIWTCNPRMASQLKFSNVDVYIKHFNISYYVEHVTGFLWKDGIHEYTRRMGKSINTQVDGLWQTINIKCLNKKVNER